MFRPTWVIIRFFRDAITFNLFVYSTYTVVVCLLSAWVGFCCPFKGSEVWWLAFYLCVSTVSKIVLLVMEWLSFKFCLLRLCMWNISMVLMFFLFCVICSRSSVFSIVCCSPNTGCGVIHNFCIYISNQNRTFTVSNQFPLCVPYSC
jgi:hypothetical protein